MIFETKNIFNITSALILCIVFLVAGIAKLVYFNDFLLLLQKYKLFPIFLIPFLAFILICVEMTTGICVLLPYTRKFGALLSCILLLCFILLIVYVYIMKIDVHCGCFAFIFKRKMNYSLALQDILLLLISIRLYKKS